MFPKNFIKTLPILLLILIFSQFQSQTYSLDELDSISEKYRTAGKLQDIIAFNKKALAQYQKQNNQEGIVAAYINIANYLAVLNKYKESLNYLDKAEKHIPKINNPELISKLYGGYGRCYTALGMYELSNKNFDKVIQYGEKIKDKSKKTKRMYIGYSWKLLNFHNMKLSDSIKKTEKKCLALLPDPLLYTIITERLLNEKQLDSAEFYLKKALSITGQHSLNQKGAVLLHYGKLYSARKEYEKALDYFFRSLAIFEKTKDVRTKRDTYKYISDTYKALKNESEAQEYLKKFSFINDSIADEEKKVINVLMEKTIKEEKKESEAERNKLYIAISIIIATALALLLLIRKSYLKKQKIKDEIINQKQEEANQLKRKVSSDIFDEIARLAKSGDPLFLPRFKEVYPEFYEKMTITYPELTSNELRFCALLKLNFSGKEIADFENVSLRTVETRKYRLRKKLQLPSEIDLNKWMMEQ